MRYLKLTAILILEVLTLGVSGSAQSGPSMPIATFRARLDRVMIGRERAKRVWYGYRECTARARSSQPLGGRNSGRSIGYGLRECGMVQNP